jgi:hypothetical protein
MQRGLPRPINRRQLPIPYVAKDEDHLGEKDLGRDAEVARDWLCQVCGDPVDDPAFAIMSTANMEFGWPPELVLDHGLLPEPCLRLALACCPELIRWEKKRLLRVQRSEATGFHSLRGDSTEHLEQRDRSRRVRRRVGPIMKP